MPEDAAVEGIFRGLEGFSYLTAGIMQEGYETILTDRYRRKYYEREVKKDGQKITVALAFYDEPGLASQDALVFPSSITGESWSGSSYEDKLFFSKNLFTESSEDNEYTVDLRIVGDCYLIRGFWFDKRKKSYDQGIDLATGSSETKFLILKASELIDERIYNKTPASPTPPASEQENNGVINDVVEELDHNETLVQNVTVTTTFSDYVPYSPKEEIKESPDEIIQSEVTNTPQPLSEPSFMDDLNNTPNHIKLLLAIIALWLLLMLIMR